MAFIVVGCCATKSLNCKRGHRNEQTIASPNHCGRLNSFPNGQPRSRCLVDFRNRLSLLPPIRMTTEKKSRLHELPKLIANENDFEKMKALAQELQRLLDEEAAERDAGRLAS